MKWIWFLRTAAYAVVSESGLIIEIIQSAGVSFQIGMPLTVLSGFGKNATPLNPSLLYA